MAPLESYIVKMFPKTAFNFARYTTHINAINFPCNCYIWQEWVTLSQCQANCFLVSDSVLPSSTDILIKDLNYHLEKIEMLMLTVSYTFFPLNTERNLIKEQKYNLHNVCIHKVWRGLWKSWVGRVCKTFFIGVFYI